MATSSALVAQRPAAALGGRRPFTAARRTQVVRAVQEQRQQRREPQPLGAMVGSALLAASLALNLSPAFVQPVLADEEEVLTPYEKRQREMEKRKEALRQARAAAEEKSAAVAAASSSEEAAPAPAPAPAARPKPFSFSAPAPVAAPPPAAAPAPPASKPAPVVAKVEKKAAPKPVTLDDIRQAKHHGLPPFLAELLVIGLFGAFVASVTKYADETGKVVAALTTQVKQLQAKAK